MPATPNVSTSGGPSSSNKGSGSLVGVACPTVSRPAKRHGIADDHAAVNALLAWQAKRLMQIQRRQKMLEQCFGVLKTACVCPIDSQVCLALSFEVRLTTRRPLPW